MNAYEHILATALREKVGEIAMTTDINEGREVLDRNLDAVDRYKRRWRWGTGVAVLAVAAAVVAFLWVFRPATQAKPSPAVSPSSSASSIPFHFTTSELHPNITVDLPYWAALVPDAGQGPNFSQFEQDPCGTAAACPAGKDRKIKFYSVQFMHGWQDGPRLTANPTYQNYLATWNALPSLGYGSIRDRGTTTIGGHPAQLLTFDATKKTPGFASCETEFMAPADCWGANAGRTYRVALVDMGKGIPMFFYESMNTNPAGEASMIAEFNSLLQTITFS